VDLVVAHFANVLEEWPRLWSCLGARGVQKAPKSWNLAAAEAPLAEAAFPLAQGLKCFGFASPNRQTSDCARLADGLVCYRFEPLTAQGTQVTCVLSVWRQRPSS